MQWKIALEEKNANDVFWSDIHMHLIVNLSCFLMHHTRTIKLPSSQRWTVKDERMLQTLNWKYSQLLYTSIFTFPKETQYIHKKLKQQDNPWREIFYDLDPYRKKSIFAV